MNTAIVAIVIVVVISNSIAIYADSFRRHRKHPEVATTLPETNGMIILNASSFEYLMQDYEFEMMMDTMHHSQQPLIEISTVAVKGELGVFTPACSDRSFWNKYDIPLEYVQAAQYFKATPIPAWSDEAYLDFKKTGNRQKGQDMMWSRQSRLPYLALAECKFYDSTYLEAIESTLMALATQRSWAFPAADQDLEYFNGERYFMDLSSSWISANIGFTVFLLNNTISTATRSTVAEALNKRVFTPLKMSFEGKAPWQWWVTSSSNHNAVIWTGVMIASFCAQENIADRNYYANKAITYSKNYLNSFSSDGYACEGVGYFNYGFSNYAVLRKLLYDGTKGSYDAFADSKATNSALFAKEFGMSQGDAANFADCHFDVFFNKGLVNTIDDSFQLSQLQANEDDFDEPSRNEGLNLVYYLASFMKTPVVNNVITKGMYDLRRYYDTSGVLVVRSNALNDGKGIAATFKLGGNFGGHSHNDIGSYVIAVHGNKMTGDVGGPLFYDADSFNQNRYKSPLMNSYGHPLPVVHGALQSEANSVIGKNVLKVVSKSFTNSVDSIVFDITGAYPVSRLASLLRTNTVDRVNQIIVVSDTIKCSSLCTFQDALVTNQKWTFTGSNTGFFSDSSNNNKLYVEVTSSAPFVWNSTLLTSYKVTFTRVGVYLTQPTTAAEFKFKFTLTASSSPSQPFIGKPMAVKPASSPRKPLPTIVHKPASKPNPSPRKPLPTIVHKPALKPNPSPRKPLPTIVYKPALKPKQKKS
jgi:hypothetical protein